MMLVHSQMFKQSHSKITIRPIRRSTEINEAAQHCSYSEHRVRIKFNTRL